MFGVHDDVGEWEAVLWQVPCTDRAGRTALQGRVVPCISLPLQQVQVGQPMISVGALNGRKKQLIVPKINYIVLRKYNNKII